MRPSLEQMELIDRYLNNQMSGQELADFQLRLGSDAALREEVRYSEEANKLILDQSLIDLKSRMRDLDKTPTGGNNIRPYIYAGIGIIAVSIVGYLALRESAPAPSTHQTERLQVDPQEQPVEKSKIIAKEQKTERPISPAKPDTSIEPELVEETPVLKSDELASQTPPASEKPVERIQEKILSENKPQEQKNVICSLENSDLQIKTQSSCSDSPTGSIEVAQASTFSGKLPIQFSLNARDYTATNNFRYLQAGTYYVSVKDGDGCIWYEAKEIIIAEKECNEPEYAFYPDRGETWKMPVEQDKSYKLEIYDRNGSLVHRSNIVNGFPDTWDGSSNGLVLPMGSYSYRLSSPTETSTGFITILR